MDDVFERLKAFAIHLHAPWGDPNPEILYGKFYSLAGALQKRDQEKDARIRELEAQIALLEASMDRPAIKDERPAQQMLPCQSEQSMPERPTPAPVERTPPRLPKAVWPVPTGS